MIPHCVSQVTAPTWRIPPTHIADKRGESAHGRQIALSPDSKLIAYGGEGIYAFGDNEGSSSGSDDESSPASSIIIRNMPAGDCLMGKIDIEKSCWKDGVHSLAFSADLQHLIFSSRRCFFVYEISSGTLKRSFECTNVSVIHIQMSDDPDMFASANLGGTVTVWSASAGREIRRLHSPSSDAANASLHKTGYVTFSKNYRLIAGSFRQKIGSNEEAHSSDEEALSSDEEAHSSDEDASGSDGRTPSFFEIFTYMYIWSKATGQLLQKVDHTEPIYWPMWYPLSTRNSPFGREQEAILTNSDRGNNTSSEDCDVFMPVDCSRWYMDHAASSHVAGLAAVMTENGLSIWPTEDDTASESFLIPILSSRWNYRHQKLMFSPDDKFLIVSTSDNIYIWELSTVNWAEACGDSRDISEWVDNQVISAFASDTGLITSSICPKGNITVQNVHTGESIWHLECSEHRNFPHWLFVTPDKQHVLDVDEHRILRIWNIGTGKMIVAENHESFTPAYYKMCDFKNSLGEACVRAVFSSDSRLIVIATESGVTLREVDTGRILWHDPQGEDPMAVSPDGTRFTYTINVNSAEAQTADREIRLVLVEDKKDNCVLSTSHRVIQLLFSPDSVWLAAETNDESRSPTGRGIHFISDRERHFIDCSHDYLDVHQAFMCFSSDSSRVAILLEDRLELWSVPSFKLTKALCLPFALDTRTCSLFSLHGEYISSPYGKWNINMLPEHHGADEMYDLEYPGYVLTSEGWICWNLEKIILVPGESDCAATERVFVKDRETTVTWVSDSERLYMVKFHPGVSPLGPKED